MMQVGGNPVRSGFVPARYNHCYSRLGIISRNNACVL